MDKRNKEEERYESLRGRRLKELAVEASRHLDDILPGGEGSEVLEKLVQPGPVRGDEGSAGGSRPGVRGRSASRGGRKSAAGPRVETASPPSESSAGTVKGADSLGSDGSATATPDGLGRAGASAAGAATARVRVQREPSEASGGHPAVTEGPGASVAATPVARRVARTQWKPGAPVSGARGKPAALVAHASHGVAKILANLLNHMGLRVRVVTSPVDVDSCLDAGPWDLFFMQGTSTPYPGKTLASAIMDRCSPSPPPVVLLSRPGDSLLAEAGGWGAVGLLQWPFSPENVSRTVADILFVP